MFYSDSGKVSLALQGGGAHGAFTWGVLDALLADGRLAFDGLSGSSAGAMNAVVLAEGWRRGGREGARQALAAFWEGVAQHMPWPWLAQGQGGEIGLSPAARLLSLWAGQFSPAQLNPLMLNPLRDLLLAQIDFAQLRAHSPFKLFVGATHAGSGKLRLFREHELTVDMLLASACLPKLHHTVLIDGEPYWDGGYSANPAVFPLYHDCHARDVLLVLLNPLLRPGTPHTAAEIETRIAELGFSAHFMREMHLYAHAAEFAGPPWLALGRLQRRLRRMRFHMIDTSDVAALKRSDTKLLAYGPFLELLRTQGRSCADAWLAKEYDAIGRHSSIDLAQLFG
jgi:NTE family protein